MKQQFLSTQKNSKSAKMNTYITFNYIQKLLTLWNNLLKKTKQKTEKPKPKPRQIKALVASS